MILTKEDIVECIEEEFYETRMAKKIDERMAESSTRM